MIPSYLEIEGRSLSLVVRKSRNAKRYTLRLRPESGGEVVLTLPAYYSKKEALSFIEKSKPWLAKQLTKTIPKLAYAQGMVLPIFGKHYELRYKSSGSFSSWWGDDHLLIHAPSDRFEHFVQKSLQQAAKQFLQRRTLLYANQIAKHVNRITLRDMRSRWGSCTADGNISYCWRLIFAPENVADYVCAHEVAHLLELNHSKKFWQIVEQFCPDYQAFRHWLRENGKTLFQYGH